MIAIEEEKPKLKEMVRVINASIVGTKQIYYALRQIKGIDYAFSNAICNIMNVDKTKKIGNLTDEEIKKVEDIIKNPSKYNIPVWLYNRKRDPDTGENLHLISADLKLKQEFDIKGLKEIKSYRGMRHAAGLPVRGQRTRAHFRKGATIGVQRKGIKMKTAEAGKEKEKKKGTKKEKEAK